MNRYTPFLCIMMLAMGFLASFLHLTNCEQFQNSTSVYASCSEARQSIILGVIILGVTLGILVALMIYDHRKQQLVK